MVVSATVLLKDEACGGLSWKEGLGALSWHLTLCLKLILLNLWCVSGLQCLEHSTSGTPRKYSLIRKQKDLKRGGKRIPPKLRHQEARSVSLGWLSWRDLEVGGLFFFGVVSTPLPHLPPPPSQELRCSCGASGHSAQGHLPSG